MDKVVGGTFEVAPSKESGGGRGLSIDGPKQERRCGGGFAECAWGVAEPKWTKGWSPNGYGATTKA